MLWLITGYPLSLVFGLLSPVMLLAHHVDARRRARRESEARARQEEHERAEAQNAREAATAEEIARMTALYPAAEQLEQLVPRARRRPRGASEQRNVRLGVRAGGHPFVVSLVEGMVLDGEPGRVREIRRALTAQAWWAMQDSRVNLEDLMEETSGGGRWLLRQTSHRVGADSGTASAWAVVDRDAPGVPEVLITPDVLSVNGLSALRDALRNSHERPVVHAPPLQSRNDLRAVIGTSHGGDAVELDLVSNGPHAIISGTTGSGKTTFVITWFRALAQRYDPNRLHVAIVDFKGGIDFAPLTELPHCVGMATDNDDGSIDRALSALVVEMSRRETAIKTTGSVDDLPRLVVVLDEFRATARAHPHAVAIVVDLTARGRALGVHVVLCTQRASSSISEDILANVPLRIAFRALSQSESRFMVGDESALTSAREPGEAIVAGIDVEPRFVRMTTPNEKEFSPASPTTTTVPIRLLWKPALPTRVSYAEIPALADVSLANEPSSAMRDTELGPLCLGLADVQSRQAWASVSYSPLDDGHLLVTGVARSGRSTALNMLAEQLRANARTSVVCADDGMALWDELDERSLTNLSAHNSREVKSLVVIVDGLERVLGSLGPDVRDALSQRLSHALREPGTRSFVISCDADGAWALRLEPLCAARLQLGGTHPGRARWGDLTMQVALPNTMKGASVVKAENLLIDVAPPQMCIVMTNNPADSAQRLCDVLESRGVRVLDRATPDEWMLRPPEFAALSRDHAVVVTADVGLAQSRMLLRAFQPVPPIPLGGALMLLPDGRYQRLNLEHRSTTKPEND